MRHKTTLTLTGILWLLVLTQGALLPGNLSGETLSAPSTNLAVQEKADVNGDAAMDLKDAILALQISAGMSPDPAGIHLSADVNGDNRIGLAEAIHALRKAAGAPFITTQPLSQTVMTGQTATFTVTAAGATPLNYQWGRNGTAINGATSASYTTPATTSSDTGAVFSVVVSNSPGSVPSGQVVLTVTEYLTVPPSLTPLPIPLVDVSSPRVIIDTRSGGADKSDANLATELQQAFNGRQGGVIVFNAHGTPRTIRISTQLYIPVQGTAPNYDPIVVLDGGNLITLDGGATSSGNGGTRIIEKAWKVNFSVQRMTFANANASNNTSGRPDDDRSGGAINVENWDGSLTVIDCTFTNCRAKAMGPDIGGGAVRCPGQRQARFSGCTFTGCSGSNGGAINSLGSELWLINCTFKDSIATGLGGGADQGGTGQGGIGGAVYIDGISNNSAHAILRVEGCRFLDNGANDHGGAIFLYTTQGSGSRSLINASTFHHNRILSSAAKVGFAGALYAQNESLTIVSSTFDANESISMGGAVWLLSDTDCRIADSTFSANRSGNHGSALQLNGPVYISNCTLVDNVCIGSWGGSVRTGTPDRTWLKNCVLANNQCANPNVGNVSATCMDGGGNFQWPSDPNHIKATSSVILMNPLLGSLADNGGPTQTHLPEAGSPVVNNGVNEQSPILDQRGLPRVGRCDAGAVERQ